MAMEDKVVSGMVVPTPTKDDDGGSEPSTSHDLKIIQDLDEALESLHEAMPGYKKAESYYDGKVGEKFLSEAVQRLLSGSATDFNVNLAGRVVDAVVDRMQITAITAEPIDDNDNGIPDEEEDSSTTPVSGDDDLPADDTSGVVQPEDEPEDPRDEALNEAVAKMWRQNEMDIEAPEIHQKMLKYGDAYLFVGLCDDQDSHETPASDTPDKVDLFFNSPMNVRVLYDDENPRKKRLAIKRWEIGPKRNKKIRLNLYYPDGGTYKFISKGSSDRSGAADFQIFVDDSTDEMGYVANDGGEIPFFHFRTSRPYGRPEHEKAYGAQDALTKLIKNMMATADFSAFPQRWALQETGTTTDDDLDWDGPDSDTADTKNPMDLQSQLISGPGRVWPLRNMKSVGQFDSADVDQFLKPINLFAGLMAATTATPVSYFLVSLTGQSVRSISGESKRRDEAPFISKVNSRQLSAAATWQDSVGYGLRLLGLEGEVTVRWSPAEVVDGVEGWKAVQEQQKAGVPVRQTLLEAGYTEAEVTSWGYTEDNPDGPGIDLSGTMNPPPVPGQPNPFQTQPGAPVSEQLPVPPSTTPNE